MLPTSRGAQSPSLPVCVAKVRHNVEVDIEGRPTVDGGGARVDAQAIERRPNGRLYVRIAAG